MTRRMAPKEAKKNHPGSPKPIRKIDDHDKEYYRKEYSFDEYE